MIPPTPSLSWLDTPWFWLAAFLVVAAIAVCRRVRRRRGRRLSEVARRHGRNVRAARRVLLTVRQIGAAANPGRVIGYLRQVPPLVFEEAILTELQDRRHPIRRSARYSGDGGADGEFEVGGRLWLIQAKRYRSAVNPAHVQAFAELCEKRGAFGVFIHTGRTGPLSRLAENMSGRLRIISGAKLVKFFEGEALPLGRG